MITSIAWGLLVVSVFALIFVFVYFEIDTKYSFICVKSKIVKRAVEIVRQRAFDLMKAEGIEFDIVESIELDNNGKEIVAGQYQYVLNKITSTIRNTHIVVLREHWHDENIHLKKVYSSGLMLLLHEIGHHMCIKKDRNDRSEVSADQWASDFILSMNELWIKSAMEIYAGVKQEKAYPLKIMIDCWKHGIRI